MEKLILVSIITPISLLLRKFTSEFYKYKRFKKFKKIYPNECFEKLSEYEEKSKRNYFLIKNNEN